MSAAKRSGRGVVGNGTVSRGFGLNFRLNSWLNSRLNSRLARSPLANRLFLCFCITGRFFFGFVRAIGGGQRFGFRGYLLTPLSTGIG